MDLLTQTANSLWQVVLVGLLLGAGLPAIFALGLKSLSVGARTNSDGHLVCEHRRQGRRSGMLRRRADRDHRWDTDADAGLLASSFGIHVF